MAKLDDLVRLSGYGSAEELAVSRGADATVPAICMNEGCDHVEDMEPDQKGGWCPDCGTTSVRSLLVLMKIL